MADDESPKALLTSGHYSLAVTRAWSLVQLRLKQSLGNPERDDDGDFFVHLIDKACEASADIADWRDDLHRLRMRRNEVDKEGASATRADAEHAVETYEGIARLTGGLPSDARKTTGAPKRMAPTPARSRNASVESDEIVYFQGSPVIRAELGRAGMTMVIALIVAGIPLAWGMLASSGPPVLVTLGCLLVAAMIVILPILFTRSICYRITSYRIDYERGILGKQFDTLELWHVDDIGFRQSLPDRLLNVGTITIASSDRSTPQLDLKGIPNAKAVFDALKDRVIAVKRQRGVIKMDAGSHSS